MSPWVDDGTLEIDGLTWAVRQSGAPDGRPLVYFHGTPSSRLETSFADDTAAALGVRLVSFDRPGYGGSAFAPFSLASVAVDTGRIADALGIDRFATTGQSGGGPFSLACGAVLGERVTRVGVTSGAGPFSRVPELMAALDDNDTAAVALLPDADEAAQQFAVGFEPFRELGSADDATIVAGFRQMCSSHDGRVLDDPQVASAIAAGLRASLVQGCEGAGWDNVAWVGPWDVELDDVRRPVHLWYGDDDPFCPAVVGPWLAQHLPDATLVLREGEGHMGVIEHREEVLTTLTRD